MNFSVHMDDKTLQELTLTARSEGRSRSALLTEAFRQYVKQRDEAQANNGWPQVLVDHLKIVGNQSFPDFDDVSDLLPLNDNAQ
jgi:metal-responsive CopG/Arc/MetJ family transcriptional regulator